jgi:hypothetical protein
MLVKARKCRSTGFRPVSPFQGPHVQRVDRAAGPVQVAAGAELVKDQAVELCPHSSHRPLGKAPVSRRSRLLERRPPAEGHQQGAGAVRPGRRGQALLAVSARRGARFPRLDSRGLGDGCGKDQNLAKEKDDSHPVRP